MRYDMDKKVVRRILRSVDMNNTLDGGRSASEISVKTGKDHLLLIARVPGASVADLKVEILKGVVQIIHPVTLESNHEPVTLPQIVAAFPIAAGIDYQNITAGIAGDRLEVLMPFNDLVKGYNRTISIN